MILTEQRVEKSVEEWVRLGEEAERFLESDLYDEILKYLEYTLMQDWVATPPGAEGQAQREAIHAKIAVFAGEFGSALRTIINEGEYASTVLAQRRSE